MSQYLNVSEIACYLPARIVSNEEIAACSDTWTAEKIKEKTGIVQRHYASKDEFTSDLAVRSAEALFASGTCQPEEVDYLVLCTQTPDYLLPTTACLVQDRLGLRSSVGAMDINLGCSGYIYGLSVAVGLIASNQANKVILLTADTYSKLLEKNDLSVRTLFGDGATATLVSSNQSIESRSVGPFVFGTDGRGAKNLMVADSAMQALSLPKKDAKQQPLLTMNGAEIFTFTLKSIPKLVVQLLEKSKLNLNDIDLFVFHQANEYMLENLRRKIGIPRERFVVSMKDCGNTVSSSIPIALAKIQHEGKLAAGMTVMLVGFGVGYSWGATLLQWTDDKI